MSFTIKGAAGSGPSATSGQRPPSRNVNRDSQEGPLMKRSDSTRSMVDPAVADQKATKDNIKVAIRIRPLSEKEHTRGDTAVWATDGTGGVGMYSSRSSTLNIKYAYDLVFDTATTNAQVRAAGAGIVAANSSYARNQADMQHFCSSTCRPPAEA
eukprot:GHUV01052336.1.p1 GENE.GHUV01052336.1~~GHUV01052336.1.p1  ORF type:complete len:155 (-),score=39.49 GHUV01052336.1:246-710(-)